MEGSDEDSDEDSETNVNRLNEMLGGADRLKPFRDLCEYLADKLNSKLTPNLRKIASQLQKDVRKKHSDVTNDTILEYSKKYFNENKSNYEKMLKDMLKNKNKKY
jgi:primosomal protein N''